MLTIDQKEFLLHNYCHGWVRITPTERNNGLNLAKLAEEINGMPSEIIEDVVASENEILIGYKENTDVSHLQRELNKIKLSFIRGKQFMIPVFFESIHALELEEKPEKLTEILCNTEFKIAMFGFIPGFVYLTGLPEMLHKPRKSVPAKTCKKGSVAIGGEYLGIYNFPSPAGWNIIGQTAIEFPIGHDAGLRIGDTLNLIAIDNKEHEFLQKHPISIIEYNA